MFVRADVAASGARRAAAGQSDGLARAELALEEARELEPRKPL